MKPKDLGASFKGELVIIIYPDFLNQSGFNVSLNAQAADVQLGMAIENTRATLAVKRRLACEMVKYWQQVQTT